MSDLISRADAIDAIPDTTADMFENCRNCKLLDREQVIDILSALPSADAVSREDYHNLLTATEDIDRALREYQAKEEADADAVKRVDCSSFLLWLLEEIMDEENWELNAVADGEIIARKLKKLGLLEVKDGYYHRIFDENVWVVRCKDCRMIDENGWCEFIGGYVHDGFCAWGERREP